ncbi:MAG: VanZ family protein [Frankiaceae bacterium]|nr:VanZ family protein [Frankiaceae bacterium]
MTAQPGAGTGDRRATVAFVAVVVLSLVVLFSPRAPGGGGIGLDKLVHASLFALLAATTWWRFAAHRAGLVAVLAYAALSEVAQSLLLASRSGDVRDVCADAAGVIVGWIVARRLSERPSRPAR